MNKSLHRLDLNLLIILQYLLEERSVSLVAARLAVTPSAVSIRDWDYNSLSEVIAGEADIGLLGRESYPKSRESISAIPDIVNFDLLFTDRPLAFIRRGHPLLSEAWTISNLIKYPHISTEYANRIPWALDDLLHDLGYSRLFSADPALLFLF